MRKKSHISLARYIVKHTSDENLRKHWLSFCVGSILPDCKPSFIYKRHAIETTFPEVKRSIERLINGKQNKRRYYLNLGQVTHHVADYFTFPHNRTYSGGLREHCGYEEKLMHRLREYLTGGDAEKNMEPKGQFASPESLYDFIAKKHEKYLGHTINMEEDIRHIVSVNRQLVEGISDLFQKTRQKHPVCHS